MDKQDFQIYITNAKKDMGWKWHWYGFTGWISDHTMLIQEVWWWMTDGLSDTQRYKTLGNAVTVNVIADVMERFIKSVKI